MLRLTTLTTLVLVLALALASAAVADPPQLWPRAEPAAPPLGTRVAGYARHFVGVRYQWGGQSPASGFDCSGLVYFVYRHFGITLPRNSYGQFDRGRRVARAALEPGDLVFFDGAGHVGIYVGRGRFVHAPHTGTVVQVSSLAGPYGGGYDGARRIR
jgi:cell wall-associated NlpC family hydrolase